MKKLRCLLPGLLCAALVFAGCTSTIAPKTKAGEDVSLQVEKAAARLEVSAPSTRMKKDPLVMVHYMPWFQAPPVCDGYGFHWHQGGTVFDPFETLPDGRAKIASQYYPLTGPYDSRDPAVLEYQVAMMKIAGIDGVIFDWYGIADALDYKEINDATLVMIQALKKAGMMFAICYEDQSIGKMVEAKSITKEESLDAGKTVFAWMKKNWFDDPAYLKFENRPVVLCFGPQFYKDQSQWSEIFKSAGVTPWFVGLDNHSEGWTDGSYDWPPMWASSAGKLTLPRLVTYLNDFYAKENGKTHLVASAFPGFHDIYKEAGNGQSYGYLDYANGATFRLTMDAALKANPDVIQIATWNDYGEGTVVEPTIEHGYRELEYLQDVQKKYAGDFAFQYADLRAPIELFRIRSSGKATQTQMAGIDAAYQAAFRGDAGAFRAALAVLGIKSDFAVNPVLRPVGAEAASAAVPARKGFDPAGKQNLALGAPVTASNHIYDFTGSKAIDGNPATYWEGAAGSWPDTVTVDLVSARQLSTLVLKVNPARIWSKRTQTLEVQTSNDGNTFATAVASAPYVFDPATNGNAVAIPLSVKARFVRLVVTANTAAKAGQIGEMEIFAE